MTDWDPQRYRRFEDERTRPALDLLARVPLDAAARVVDIGCGPGNSTEVLAARFPAAEMIGIDSSPAMIEAARARLPHCRFEQADVAAWQPEAAPDLIFANAVLQWVPNHEALLPRLMATLARGGVLAVQMPNNLDAPSHRAMRAVASQEPWAERLVPAGEARTILPPVEAYYDLLASSASSVELWETTYNHPMASPAAIVDWVSATGLRPFLSRLDADEQAAFVSRYEARLESLYPARADGLRLLGYRRMFIVAKRS